MTPSEVAALLAYTAAYDNRTPSESAARAWAEALHPDLTLTEAKRIVRTHYTDSTEWVMPAHLNRAFGQLRRHRLETIGTTVPPPAGLNPAEEQAWTRSFRRAIGAGANAEKATRYAEQTLIAEAQLRTETPRTSITGNTPQQGQDHLKATLSSIGKDVR